jgi:hypothetical protein
MEEAKVKITSTLFVPAHKKAPTFCENFLRRWLMALFVNAILCPVAFPETNIMNKRL